jgi:AraC-like DNA-binding protein
MQTLYSTAGKNPIDAWACWSAMSAQEFYEGTIEACSSQPPNLVLGKSLAFPISLTHLRCGAPIAYRRSWQHIRDNRSGARVIWFVKRGSLVFRRSQGTFRIGSGDAGVLDSCAPFAGKIMCDSESVFESFQAVIPEHLYLTHFSKAASFSGVIPLTGRSGRLVEHLLSILAFESDCLGRSTTEPLVSAFLAAIADCMAHRQMQTPQPQRLADSRFRQVQNTILMNLSDPKLDAAKVAASCRISTRYLHHLLKTNNTSFSELLWQNRLRRARDHLGVKETGNHLIQEVAYMSGFKSAAHFCRVFKRAYGASPSRYRAAQQRVNLASAEARAPMRQRASVAA